MVGGNPARYLAPVALVATAVATYLVVSAHLHPASPSAPVPRLANGHRAGRGSHRHAAFYTVQAGENLTSIAAKTGIPVATLEQLNPSVDPNSLQTGQRLRLRR